MNILNILFGDGEPTHVCQNGDYWCVAFYPYNRDETTFHNYQYQKMTKNWLGVWSLETCWVGLHEPLDSLKWNECKRL